MFGHSIDGIDVSHHQGIINWGKVAGEGVKFAFIKATDGTSFVDPKFERNWEGARSVGIPRGAYLFFRQGLDGAAQAKHFLEVAPLTAGALLPVVDVEDFNGIGARDYVEQLVQCVTKIKSSLKGRWPIIYSSASVWRSLGNPDDLSDAPLWVAHYTSAPKPKIPQVWESYAFWQYSESGHLAGITDGNVDFDIFAGDDDRLKTFFIA